jgi:predicted Zn finger-like uncharacterized protein
MAQILRTWSPDPFTCPYCETFFRWDTDDVVFAGPAGHLVVCPTCGYELQVLSKLLPKRVRDIAEQKQKDKGRWG